MWRRLLFVLYLTASNAENDEEWRLVETTQGPVRGRRDNDADDIFVFYNIPYATAPTGENKFKAPLPPPQWTEPYYAIDKGVICPQADAGLDLNLKSMQEDCLIANVYVPDTKEENLSVVVLVHGGALQVGFGDWTKLKQMMSTKKIIVVNFNYRLGIRGFLCLGTKDVPGNGGMKDIVAMLRWVKKNIASFGGNPEDITVSGYSAGAVAVDLLILSKSAKGLFKKAIIESGANVAPFSVQFNPLENAQMYAKRYNFTNVDDVYALEKFYKTASDDILKADPFLSRQDSTFVFVPCIERDVGEEVFLDDSPINILKRGDYAKVPMLVGFANMEGLFRAPFFDSWKNEMNENFTKFLPVDLKFSNDEQQKEVTRQIKEFYFGDKPIDTDTILGYIDYYTDILFAGPALRSVNLNVASGNNKIFLYLYSFVDENDPYVPYTKVRGANHCAQSHAIFDDEVGPSVWSSNKNATTAYTNLRKMMRKMWHDFITDGEPIPAGTIPRFLINWPPTTADRKPYMSLSMIVQRINNVLLEKRVHFWDDIYSKYYRQPLPPPTLPIS